MKLRRFLLFLFIFILTTAAKRVTIQIDGAELKENISSTSRVIDHLKKGTPITVSNTPTGDYYKAKTQSGVVGWVKAQDIGLEAGPKIFNVSNDRGGVKDRSWRLALTGGLDFFYLRDVNSFLGIDGLKSGLGLSLEAQKYLGKDFWLLVRLERTSKTISASDFSGQYSFDASVIPVMAGVAYQIAGGAGFEIHMALLAGVGVSAQVAATAVNLAGSNVTRYQGTAMGGMFKTDISFKLVGALDVMGEVGYRVLTTAQLLGPVVEGAGNTIFQSSGAYVPFRLDFGGAYIRAGVILSL